MEEKITVSGCIVYMDSSFLYLKVNDKVFKCGMSSQLKKKVKNSLSTLLNSEILVHARVKNTPTTNPHKNVLLCSSKKNFSTLDIFDFEDNIDDQVSFT